MGEKPSPTCAVTKQRRRHLQHDRRPLLPGDRRRRLQHDPPKERRRPLLPGNERSKALQDRDSPRHTAPPPPAAAAAAAAAQTVQLSQENNHPCRRLRGPSTKEPFKVWPSPCHQDPWARKTRSSNKRLGAPSSTTCPASSTSRSHPGRTRAQGSKQNVLKRQLSRSRPQDNRQMHSLHHPKPPKLPTRLLQPEESCGDCPPLLLAQPAPSHKQHMYP